MIAADVAMAFNSVNERKSWAARPHASGGREAVHFTAPANLVTLVLECDTQRFQVRFNKMHAAWGDYTRAIARSLHIVLSTLKMAGQPFESPDDIEGIEIVTTVAEKGVTYVAWPGQSVPTPDIAVSTTPAYGGKLTDMTAQLLNAAHGQQAVHDNLMALGAKWDGMDGYDLSGVQELKPADPVEDATMPEIRADEGN